MVFGCVQVPLNDLLSRMEATRVVFEHVLAIYSHLKHCFLLDSCPQLEVSSRSTCLTVAQHRTAQHTSKDILICTNTVSARIVCRVAGYVAQASKVCQ